MKKNKMMRLASALLVAVMLSTSVISGTYAKYVTEHEVTETARVAKWGVTVNAEGVTQAFAKSYDTTVNAEAGSELDIVAPGTDGILGAINFAGTPEVAGQIDFTCDLTLTDWYLDTDKNNQLSDSEKVDTNEYCPIIITVNSEEFYIGKAGITTVAELISAVEAKIEGYNVTFGPNANLAGLMQSNNLVVTWEWPFSTTTFENISDEDVKDTNLGDLAANGNAAKIGFTVKARVTQLD